jgi:RNA polymerase-binding protein DksA
LIRQRLMRHRRLLLARYRSELERIDEQLDHHEAEEVERATDFWDTHVLSRLGETDARMLREVVDALHRLDAGTYGKCMTCGEGIGDARIDAIPTATLCIGCADQERPRDASGVPRRRNSRVDPPLPCGRRWPQ